MNLENVQKANILMKRTVINKQTKKKKRTVMIEIKSTLRVPSAFSYPSKTPPHFTYKEHLSISNHFTE